MKTQSGILRSFNFLKLIFVFGIIALVVVGCGGGDDDGGGGGCTVDCSDLGGSTDITLYSNISEDDCRAHADAETAEHFPCKVWYCPPTGNEDDCYRVYSEDDGPSEEDIIARCIDDNCPPLWPGGPRSSECMADCGYEPPTYTGLTTTAVPPGGVYNVAQEVELVVNVDISPYDVCLLNSDSNVIETYYTTDNSTPTTSSQLYTDPILIAHDTNLKFFSIRSACKEQYVNMESYTINE